MAGVAAAEEEGLNRGLFPRCDRSQLTAISPVLPQRVDSPYSARLGENMATFSPQAVLSWHANPQSHQRAQCANASATIAAAPSRARGARPRVRESVTCSAQDTSRAEPSLASSSNATSSSDASLSMRRRGMLLGGLLQPIITGAAAAPGALADEPRGFRKCASQYCSQPALLGCVLPPRPASTRPSFPLSHARSPAPDFLLPRPPAPAKGSTAASSSRTSSMAARPPPARPPRAGPASALRRRGARWPSTTRAAWPRSRGGSSTPPAR